uniref:Transmembrane protein n=1 Tax=Trepomonas sp. PC1 TaxID=1076344 RepID=A0A146K0S9_9EUKA|eukprot:JAP89336.1 Hypothetical protein TPC1_31169 [Trepomonas sp. PC1]
MFSFLLTSQTYDMVIQINDEFNIPIIDGQMWIECFNESSQKQKRTSRSTNIFGQIQFTSSNKKCVLKCDYYENLYQQISYELNESSSFQVFSFVYQTKPIEFITIQLVDRSLNIYQLNGLTIKLQMRLDSGVYIYFLGNSLDGKIQIPILKFRSFYAQNLGNPSPCQIDQVQLFSNDKQVKCRELRLYENISFKVEEKDDPFAKITERFGLQLNSQYRLYQMSSNSNLQFPYLVQSSTTNKVFFNGSKVYKACEYYTKDLDTIKLEKITFREIEISIDVPRSTNAKICARFKGDEKCSTVYINYSMYRKVPLILGGDNLICVETDQGQICHKEEETTFNFYRLSDNSGVYVAFGFACFSFIVVLIVLIVNQTKRKETAQTE